MLYAMLLKPHANTRYRQSLQTLALTELGCTLQAWGVSEKPVLEKLGGESFLVFETDELPEEAWRAISNHSGCCFAARLEQGALIPLERGEPAYFPDELAQVLKYKGKTNADFTLMLLHCAKAASDFACGKEPLTVLDPLCGKATTLFAALQEGNNSIGVELDAKALAEVNLYFERTLKLHRFKYKRTDASLTLPRGRSARASTYTVADSPESQKRGDVRTLRLINGDLNDLDGLVKPASCHLAVGDLPYGVQHAPHEGKGMSSLERLVIQAAQGCARALKPGGALAFSFNSFTLKPKQVMDAMEAAGLTVMKEAPYDGFGHWVEQAVDRDAVVARKEQ